VIQFIEIFIELDKWTKIVIHVEIWLVTTTKMLNYRFTMNNNDAKGLGAASLTHTVCSAQFGTVCQEFGSLNSENYGLIGTSTKKSSAQLLLRWRCNHV